MGEIYRGYLIIAGPNDPGWMVRFPAVNGIALTSGIMTKTDAYAFVDNDIGSKKKA